MLILLILMKGYRPPRILTQADVITTPTINARSKPSNNYLDKNVHLSSMPKLSIRLDPINPEQTKRSELSSNYSSSLNNLNSRHLLQPLNKNLMKNILRESYSKQLQYESNRKKVEKAEELQSQKQYLSRFEKQSSIVLQQKSRIREQYKKQLQSEIQEKKMLIDHVKTEETALERAFQKPRSDYLQHKSGSFKKFYEQASKFQSRVEEGYKGYMKKEQQYIKTRNIDKISNFESHYDLMIHQKRELGKLDLQRKNQWRRILDEQIESKQKARKQQFNSFKTRTEMTNIHDPILNPIDYKMDIRNKYIMGELIRRAEHTTETVQ